MAMVYRDLAGAYAEVLTAAHDRTYAQMRAALERRRPAGPAPRPTSGSRPTPPPPSQSRGRGR